MGRSEEKTDIFGNRYVQHYDDRGRKIGRSEFRKGIFGHPDYTQHFDEEGVETGRTEEAGGIIGPKYAQHYDAQGRTAGNSEERWGLLDGEFTEHFDGRGRSVGRSHHDGEAVEHHGDVRRAARPLIKPSPPRREFRPTPSRTRGDSDDESDFSHFFWGMMALCAAIVVAIAFAVWRYRHVRALFFLYLSAVAQFGVFVTLNRQTHFVIAALAAAAASCLFFRFCFSAWRWRAEPGRRAKAWTISGALAVTTLVGYLVVGLTQPTFVQDPMGVVRGAVTAEVGRARTPASPIERAQATDATQPPQESDSPEAETPPDLAGREDDQAYSAATRDATREAYGSYLQAYPSGRHAEEARAAIQSMEKPTFPPYDLAQLHPQVRAAVERARENESRANFAAERAREAAQRAELVVPRAQNREPGTRVITRTFSQPQRTVRTETEWSDGAFNGYGVQTVIAGEAMLGHRYVGQFSQGQSTGFGIVYLGSNPSNRGNVLRFEGEFRNDRFGGPGVKYWRSGERFAGSFNETGEINGPGVLYWPNGRRHEGEYDKDISNGYGVLWDSEGQVSQQGIWNRDLITPLTR